MAPSTYSSEPEPPFRPREKIVEKQRFFQSVRKPTYLKGRYDVVTSVAIPLALAASSMFLVVSWTSMFHCASSSVDILDRCKAECLSVSVQGRGIYNMSHGIGRKE